MVRTSTAGTNNHRCPSCGDALTQDASGKGFVAHVSNRSCLFERGQRDAAGLPVAVRVVGQPTLPDHQPTGGVRVCGYSERGIFNALLYDIGFSADPVSALAGLLSLVRIPGAAVDFSGLEGAEVLVEQSLSDFGDADVILLLHGAGWNRVVFIEGKVKPSQRGSWTATRAWRDFQERKNGYLHSSNLFTQLYHKVRFMSTLRVGGIDALQAGVPFPACSTNELRKLGRNAVVLRAARMIERYATEAFYIAALPDSVSNLTDFYANQLMAGPADDVTGWDIAGWGFVAWEQVEAYCRQHGLHSTVRTFEFNRGQIY